MSLQAPLQGATREEHRGRSEEYAWLTAGRGTVSSVLLNLRVQPQFCPTSVLARLQLRADFLTGKTSSCHSELSPLGQHACL